MSIWNKVEADLDKSQKGIVRNWIQDQPVHKSPTKKQAKKKIAVERELPRPKKNFYRDNVKPISDHVFGNKTRLELPSSVEALIDPEPTDHTRKVKAWIDKQTHKSGESYKYNNESYLNGVVHTARDWWGNRRRPLRIGKLLEDHKAPEAIKKAYMNDPYRTAVTKKESLATTVSRHPYDVAGMSTNRGWSSCMDMKEGCYSDNSLPQDIKHGTHVAYLHHKTDKTISKPVARVALKPYHAEGHPSILVAEDQHYGSAPDSFHKGVDTWAKKHFPQKDNVVYERPKGVYNDSDHDPFKIKYTSNKELFSKNSPEILNRAAYSSNGDYYYDSYLPDKKIHYNEVQHLLPHLETQEHGHLIGHIATNMVKPDLTHLANHENKAIRCGVVKTRWRDLPKVVKNKLLEDKSPSVRHEAELKHYDN